MQKIRIVTFNIRHGQGIDNKVDIKRTAQALSLAKGDLMGLQEVDKYTSRSGFCHQPRFLGHMLLKHWVFGANIEWLPGIEYGNTILSQWPLIYYRNHLLPGSGEQRGLLEAGITIGLHKVHFFCTHLGLKYEDRVQQVDRIMEIVTKVKKPLIIVGDFNFKRGSREFNTLSESFHEVTGNTPEQPDFIFLSRHWITISSQPVYSGASDHLAVVAEIRLA